MLENGYTSAEDPLNQYHNLWKNLQSDHRKYLRNKETLQKDIQEFRDLLETITHLKQHRSREVKTLVDIGCEFLCEGVIEDPSRIFVDIGLGINAEMTLEEATLHVTQRINQLQQKLEHLDESIAENQANSRIVSLGINELQKEQPG
ncbi:putative Prefoldin subunit [Blattamonas nauphoetae]|uniref:Prefoldin subunit n=1 Tax=Blattamonas nauphoetae TaxID=2049346 RepID=A0ABQ9YMC4_9EUKA|nr:putative Prefoldin subunit [Blattamonas nauphoetae]